MNFRFEKPGLRLVRPSVAGHGVVERLRAGGFALLGMTALFGLSIVALMAQQGAPLLPSLPLPAPSEDADGIAGAVRVDRPGVSARVGANTPAVSPRLAGDGRGDREDAGPAQGGALNPPPSGVVVEPGASLPSPPDPSPVTEVPASQAPPSAPAAQPTPSPESAPATATAAPTKPVPPARGRGNGHGHGRGNGPPADRPPPNVDSGHGRGNASALPDRGNGWGKDRRDEGAAAGSRGTRGR